MFCLSVVRIIQKAPKYVIVSLDIKKFSTLFDGLLVRVICVNFPASEHETLLYNFDLWFKN